MANKELNTYDLIATAKDCANNGGVCYDEECPFYKQKRCFDSMILYLADRLNMYYQEVGEIE
ncbi:MAG: hypothetical protein IKU47_08070 [Oscillospiraceae bacterium]|nr:hypothetical protein [Oscillospiraceae bacterium]